MQKNLSTIDVSTSKSSPNLIHLYQKSQNLSRSTQIGYSRTNKPSHFLELAIFKQQKNEFPTAHSYRQFSSKVRFYRTLFFAMALLFLTLGTLIFFPKYYL